MKKIGLLGGMTCESSLVYCKLINEMIREKRGGGGLRPGDSVIGSKKGIVFVRF